MARAAANRRPTVSPLSLEDRAELLRGLIGTLSLAAMQFVSQAKVDETVRHWLAGGRAMYDKEHDVAAIGEVLALAMDAALFTPAATGRRRSTASPASTGRPMPTSGPPWPHSSERSSVFSGSKQPILKAGNACSTSPPATACACSTRTSRPGARGW